MGRPKSIRICSIEGCGGPHYGLGYCGKHWQRFKIYGDPVAPFRGGKVSCSIEGCDKDSNSRGLCRPHYMQWYRHGDPGSADITDKRKSSFSDFKGCSIPLCDNDHKARGLCERHYSHKTMMSHKYNLEWEDYINLGEKCDWTCKGCGIQKLPHETPGLNIDHCHETGMVRGLLCGNCNRSIGLAQNSSDILRKLAAYLEDHHAG